MRAHKVLERISEKNTEIAALREALDGVRWCQNYDEYRAVPTYFDCAFCGQEKSDPEVHSPTCKIGRLFAKEESQSGEVEAYKSFLRAILGTVYGRVDK